MHCRLRREACDARVKDALDLLFAELVRAHGVVDDFDLAPLRQRDAFGPRQVAQNLVVRDGLGSILFFKQTCGEHAKERARQEVMTTVIDLLKVASL